MTKKREGNDLTPGVVRLERVQVTCPGCGGRVEAVARDGVIRGWCSISRQRVNFLIEMGKNPTAKIFAEKRWQTPDEVKDGVVRDYLAGDKTIVIQLKHGISPGKMYRILGGANVELRTDRKPKQQGAGRSKGGKLNVSNLGREH